MSTPNNLISLLDGKWHSDVGWGSLPSDAEGVWLETITERDAFKIMGGGNGSGNTGADHEAITIKPKDHIIFSCEIATGAPTIPRSLDLWNSGGRIGIDLGDLNQLHGGGSFGISDTKGLGIASETDNTYVKFGQGWWTKKTIDFIVQDNYVSNQVNTNTFIPDFAIPWLQVWSANDGLAETGNAWFSNPEFYVISPIPTPQKKSLAARVPMVGNSQLTQVYFRRLRDKVFTKKQHERLHPLI